MKTLKKPIYLDYLATTPIDPQVTAIMVQHLQDENSFGNPASQSHLYGWQAAEKIATAREQVAHLLHADPREMIWTSGATEANNMAIKGAALFYQRQGKHIITMASEHSAVLETCAYLETIGFEVTYLRPQLDGLLNLADFTAAIRPDTILVSIMHVNNETGVIQDIAKIGQITRKKGIIFHCDAAQSAGKLAIDVQSLDVDLLSVSSHKLYGPKGIAALYVRRTPRIRLVPLIHGGGQEQALRSGTLPTHQIMGMGAAFTIAKQRLVEDQQHCQQLINRLWAGIQEVGDVVVNGSMQHKVCNSLNVSFAGIDSETLMVSLHDLAISSHSACKSATHDSSHVLTAMGIDRDRAAQALRFSVGRFTTMDEIDHAISHITTQVRRLREISPV